MLDEEREETGKGPTGKDVPKVVSTNLTPGIADAEQDKFIPLEPLPPGKSPDTLYDPTPPGKFKQAITAWILNKGLLIFFRFLQKIAPLFRFPGMNTIIVTRFDDVQEIFARNKDFVVPYIGKAAALKWDPTFVLAMKHDDQAYQHMIGNMRRLWLDSDLAHITEISEKVSLRALKSHGGKLDAVQDLMLPVVLHVLKDYYGMPMEGLVERDRYTVENGDYDSLTDEEKKRVKRLEAFIAGTNAIAGYVFGPQKNTEKGDKEIRWAGNSVWPYLYDATNSYDPEISKTNTIVGRARDLRGKGEMEISDAELRSIILGMIAGFLPTNTNANGKAFDVLMRTESAREAAQAAVDRGDDDALLGIIYEAQRHQYILPGLWRMTEKDQQLRIGQERQKPIKEGRLLYISGMAAMWDPRRVEHPKEFIGNRSRDIYMIYGHRFHYCIGAHLSDKMMLAMFKSLFRQGAKYQDGEKPTFRGNIPWNIPIQYEPIDEEA